MITGARLVNLDGTELLAFAGDPLRLQQVFLGYPDVRGASTPLPGRSGEEDTTRYTGASAVTLDIAVQDGDVVGRDVWLDRIRGYCRPGLRAWLYLASTDWSQERRILVRGDQAPVMFSQPGVQRVSIGLRAPLGVWESAQLTTYTLFPTSGGEGGFATPVVFPVTLDPGNVPGAASITAGGTEVAYPYVDIYGFCADPVLKNLTTGEQVAFVGLTIQAGDFLRVDLGGQAALLSNDAGQSRLSLLDFTTSTWWGLDPGVSQVAFVPGNPGPSCQAVLAFRDTMI